jgi:DNA-binding GntR family transcriptional regulator
MTRAEWVDTQLRRAILHGELAPGERLRAEHLAQQFGVSPTPLRETFMRLAGEGLVVVEPQRGARVAPLDLAEAIEVYEMRLLLDPVALARAIDAARQRHGAYVAAVTAAHEALMARHDVVSAYHDAHRAFHLALVWPCPNRRLVRQVEQLLDQSQRFHAVGFTAGRAQDAAREHAALADAALAGDVERAVTTLRSHLTATLAVVTSSAS